VTSWHELIYTCPTPPPPPSLTCRADAADWPGGGVTEYLERLRTEVIPWVMSHYPVSSDPADMAYGGSSFGGIAALVAGLQGEGCGFGALLVESPSMWIGEGSFLEVGHGITGCTRLRVLGT
jgi:predicted alpha/beta superfamily hydrolase